MSLGGVRRRQQLQQRFGELLLGQHVWGQALDAGQAGWFTLLPSPVLRGFFQMTRVAIPSAAQTGEEAVSPSDSHLSVVISLEEVAFRKKRLCIKFIPRDSTEAAICDIRIMGRTKQAPPQYTFIG